MYYIKGIAINLRLFGRSMSPALYKN